MSTDRVNLLPANRIRVLTRDYYIRLGVVVLVLATVLAGIAALLLLPTYIFLSASLRTADVRLASASSTLSSSDGATFSARLSALSSNAAMLNALANAPSVSAIVRAALGVSRQGIAVSSVTYTRGAGSKPSVITISGMAATRNALRKYQLALQGAPFARAVDLPVSVYAKDTDNVFTATITLAP